MVKLDYTVVFDGVGIYAGIVVHISVAAPNRDVAKRVAWMTLSRGMKVPLDQFEVRCVEGGTLEDGE